jgi:O-antigen ligase
VGTSIAALKYPQVGVFAYSIMSIMAPQYIWPWVFEGIPAFTIVAGSTLLAFGLALLFGKIDFSVYRHKQNVLLIILCVFFNLSDVFSPFQEYSSLTSADLVLNTFNTIILMYFVALPLVSKQEYLKIIFILFIGIIVYYVYWSNDAYFNFDPRRFGYGSRLYGPYKSPYRDQNVFAAIFVIGMPFLLFGFFYFKSIFVKGLLGFAGLFALHSVILTGSRGALVGISVVVIFSYFLIKSRGFGVLLIVGFIAAIMYQGGQLLDRTTNTIEVAQEESEASIDPRIQSWLVGIELIQKFPVLGVGVQRFQQATRVYFPQNHAYVAHNTFLNFAANTGIISGLIYLYFYLINFRNFRFAIKNGIEEEPLLDLFNKVFMTSLTGFYVCSMFLDLIIFEGFYFLLMLNLLKDHIFRKHLAEKKLKSEVSSVAVQPKIKSFHRGANA